MIVHILKHGLALCGWSPLESAEDKWVSFQDYDVWKLATCEACKEKHLKTLKEAAARAIELIPEDELEKFAEEIKLKGKKNAPNS